MAYNSINISTLSCANGFTIWHYDAKDDTASDIFSTGYFSTPYSMLRKGDLIITNTNNRTDIIQLVITSDKYDVRLIG